MKNKFKDLTTYMKTAIIAFGCGTFVAAIFLVLGICKILPIFISLGILLGAFIGGLSYVLQDKITYMNCDDSKKLKYTMAVMFIGSFCLLVLGALVMIMHFKASKEAFEAVAMLGLGFLGSYLFTTGVYTVIYFRSKKTILHLVILFLFFF